MDSSEIRKHLGRCLWIGFDGLELPTNVAKFIRENFIGGVSLFSCNYKSPEQVAKLNGQIQAARAPGEPPLAIAVDHEGGKVQRFRKPFTHFPEVRVLSEMNSPKLAFECAEIMAKELKAVGVNVIYAPVADINTNPENPIIGRRSFGETEEIVSKMVSAQVRGFVTGGVEPVVKHFPGHGDTSQDSHTHLPRVSTPLQTILDREIKPFIKGFKSHCAFVMTAHIIVDSVDPKVPATLSAKILNELLREQCRFKGFIISDDMEMKAIADHYGPIDAPVDALAAGVDLLLYHTMPAVEAMFEPVLEVLSSAKGARALENLEKSSERFLQFRKEKFSDYKAQSKDQLMKHIGTPQNLAVEAKIKSGKA